MWSLNARTMTSGCRFCTIEAVTPTCPGSLQPLLVSARDSEVLQWRSSIRNSSPSASGEDHSSPQILGWHSRHRGRGHASAAGCTHNCAANQPGRGEYALTTRAGVECVTHVIQTLTDLDHAATVLSVDGVGAFNLVSRAMLEGLRAMEGGDTVLLCLSVLQLCFHIHMGRRYGSCARCRSGRGRGRN